MDRQEMDPGEDPVENGRERESECEEGIENKNEQKKNER